MDKNYLYGILFTYNHETRTWHSFKSETMSEYFNSGKSELSAKGIDHIIETLGRRSIRGDKEDESKRG